jgi:hypothetical protein
MPETELMQPMSRETIGLYIYLSGVIILPFLFIILNRCFKWISKEEDEDGNAGMVIIGCIALWPAMLSIGASLLLFNLFSKLAFPSINPKL